jgi:glycine/D-amino acid oxidase-like deaminating enzyme
LTTAPAWGHPPWTVAAPPGRGEPPPACDVAIVGGGLTGLSAAYHLARHGARVVVLEAERIGAGASGRSGAIVLEGTAMGPLEDADDCLGTLAHLVADAAIDCDLDLGGCWELEHAAPGVPARPLWDDGDLVLHVARVEPGGTVDAGRLLSGLAHAATEAGAVIVENAHVLPIADAGAVAVAGRDAVFRARHVLVATEALTGSLVRLPDDVRTALTLAVATEPLDAARIGAIGLGERRPFYTGDLPYLWGRLLADGRLVLGAGLVFPDDGDVRRVSIAHPAAVAAFERLEARARAFHPSLATAGHAMRWGGPVSFRRDGAPICGHHPDWPHVVVTGAYAGHGVALAVHLGAVVARAIAEGQPLPAWGRVSA